MESNPHTPSAAASCGERLWPRGALALGSALFLFACAAEARAAESGRATSVSFALDTETRELAITLDGRNITPVRKDAPGSPARRAQVWFRSPQMAVPLHGHDTRSDDIADAYRRHCSDDDQVVQRSHFDAEKREFVDEYRWGRIAYRYGWESDRLDLSITVRNASDRSIWQIDVPLLDLALSRESRLAKIAEAYFGSPAEAREAIATFQPVVLPLLDGDRALVACSSEQDKPLTLRWAPPRWYQDSRQAQRHDDPVAQELADAHAKALQTEGVDDQDGQDACWHLSLTLGGDRLVEHDRYTTRTIGPGEADTAHVSLRFGDAAQPMAPAMDVVKAFARKHPQVLNWPDRRIILRSFLGDQLTMRFPPGPELVKPEPVVPDETFRAHVSETAAGLIADAQAVDAQGVVVWNIEGPNHRFLGYVGDPRMIEYMSPEMDALADDFFARLRAAGLRTGVTLRPRRVHACRLPPEWKGFKEKYHTDSDWIYGATYPRAADEVVDLLSDMVKYAKARWGCTLFYIDTNIVNWGPTPEEEADWPRWSRGGRSGQFLNYRALMNTDQWRRLLAKHPDCLFIPEHGGLLHYACSAPYDQLNMKAGGTPPIIRATWPEAFKCLAIEPRDVPYNYPAIVEIFRHRDIVMANPGVRHTAQAYRDAGFEAALRDRQPPADIEAMGREPLLALVANAEAPRESRYYAARRLLGASADRRAETLNALLTSQDGLIARMALLTLGNASDIAVLETLADRWCVARRDRNAADQTFVEAAVARIGAPAIPALIEMRQAAEALADAGTERGTALREQPYFLAKALAEIGTPEALAELRRWLGQEQASIKPSPPYLRYLRQLLKE